MSETYESILATSTLLALFLNYSLAYAFFFVNVLLDFIAETCVMLQQYNGLHCLNGLELITNTYLSRK